MEQFFATGGSSILSIILVLAGGGLFKVVIDRVLTRATAKKTAVEGEVTQSTDDRAWVAQAREDVKAAQEYSRAEVAAAQAQLSVFRKVAEDCRESLWRAQDIAAECRTESVALRERVDHLEQSMRECPRPGCPLRALAGTLPTTTDGS